MRENTLAIKATRI